MLPPRRPVRVMGDWLYRHADFDSQCVDSARWRVRVGVAVGGEEVIRGLILTTMISAIAVTGCYLFIENETIGLITAYASSAAIGIYFGLKRPISMSKGHK